MSPPLRVMVVDDQEDVRFLLRTVLTEAGDIEVVAEAASGDEAVRVIGAADPDILLLDAMMPGLDGMETTVRVLDARPAQRIVLCSSAYDPAVWARAEDAGVSACVSKDDIFGLPDVLRGLAPSA